MYGIMHAVSSMGYKGDLLTHRAGGGAGKRSEDVMRRDGRSTS